MKTKLRYFLISLLSALILTLAGCVSNTKIFIPEQLQPVADNYARIVVKRTRQLAGMTTPVYIMDIANEQGGNGVITVRIGKWIKQPGLSLWYVPDMLSSFSPGGFMVIPGGRINFEESDLTLDDLLNKNLNAVIYVDELNSNPDDLPTLSCGNGDRDCDAVFRQELKQNNGIIIGSGQTGQIQSNSRNVQVVGKIKSGDTLIWDRKPGLMRIGALWGANLKTENIVEITPGNIEVEAGKTYYLNYELSLSDKTWEGDRWTITGVE